MITSRNPSESEAIFNVLPLGLLVRGELVVTLPNRKPFSTNKMTEKELIVDCRNPSESEAIFNVD